MLRWLPLLLALLAALPAHAASDPAGDAARARAQEALAQARGPRGVPALVRLHALRDEVDLALLERTYTQVLARPDTDAGVRATAQLFLAEVARSQGREDAARALTRQLGFVGDWWVLGAFDNEGKGGCDKDWGPEATPARPDLEKAWPAVGDKEARWRRLPVQPADGFVDLGAAVRPNRDAVVYALTWLEAPRAGTVPLALGTSGAFRLWVNGEPAARSDTYNLPRPDQARVEVTLRKGLNPVLLKVCQDAGALGFYVREERPFARAVALDAAPASVAKAAKVRPARALPTVSERLRALADAKPQDAWLRADYATALAFYRSYDAREHTAMHEAERAAALAPREARLQLLAAGLQQDDANLRRKLLEAALKGDPASVEGRLALARHELDRGHPERALPLFEAVRQDAPGAAGAWLGLARAHEALGAGARAEALLEEAARALPGTPAVVRAQALAARRMGRGDEAMKALEQALRLRADDRASRALLAQERAARGDVDGAAREWGALVAQDPFDLSARLQLGELLAANGRAEAAQRAFAEARALAPEEPDVFEREGKALLAAGNTPLALPALERALALRPQNPDLKELVRSLRGENEALGLQHLVDVGPRVKDADAYPNEDAVYLADVTYTRVQRSGLSSRLQQLAVKVLDRRGVEAFRTLPISYSPGRQEVRVVRARVTKPDGSVVETYGESDRNINEPWSGMYYDARAKVLSFPALAAGDVLEVVWRLDDTALDNLLSDYWGNVDSVQSTYPKLEYRYLVDMPETRPLYWNEGALPGLAFAREKAETGRALYRWSMQRVPKVTPEPSMPGWAEVAGTLHVSTYKTWDEVGRYYWGLVRDQLTPNAELRRTVDQALEGVDRKDPRKVVSAVYNWVVTNTRYVALEFGIHGYKPYRVDRVLARRFGDCKDKASLIHAMLKVAGVDSRLVLLRMRHLGAIGEAPASLAAFNHAIVYVPLLDTYLDGTAEFHGAKELPSSDRVANVLIVQPDGQSTFLTTPEARAEDNLTQLTVDVALQPDGSARASGRTEVGGQSAPEYRRAYQSPSTRKSTFERAWAQAFPGLTVRELKFNEPFKLDEDVAVDFRMDIPRYAEAQGAVLRFWPFLTGRSYSQSYAPLAERSHDLVLTSPWTNKLTVRYRLPQGFLPASLPPAVEETSPFGRMRLSYRMEAGQLVADGEVALTRARVKAEDYPAFRAFLGRVDAAFGRRVELRTVQGAASASTQP